MNKTKTRTFRSCLALFMALCMVFGLFGPATSIKADAAENVINYVSIGDSMANGYCFTGYKQGEDGIDFLNGVNVYGQGAYPLQFEEWLNGQGYEVNHTKLAVSALRAEDLNFLLGGREEPQDGWQNQVNGYTRVNDDIILSEFYKTAVTNADVITLGVGNASFGAYMLHRVTDALGLFGASLSGDEIVDLSDALAHLDGDQKQVVLSAYDQMKAELINAIPDPALVEKFNVEQICDILAYTAAGFIVNYEQSLEQIIALNPNVEIILVGLMNTTYGMEITADGMEPIAIGDIMDGFFGALNAYVAGLPAVMQAAGKWEDATFYYAEQPNPLFISQQFEELKNQNWDDIQDGRLSGEIVRERNITAYNDSLREMIGQLLGYSLSEIKLSDVERYTGTFSSYEEAQINKEMSVAIYLGIEDAVAASCNTMEIPLDGLITIATNLGSAFDGLNHEGWQTPAAIRNGLGGYLTSTDTLKGMCKIYALFKVGNGMSVHPTPEGHDQIAQAVIDAYKDKHTAKDETVKNINLTLDALYGLLETYGPEVAAQVWAQWEEYGYVDAVNATITELETLLQSRYTYYTETALPAIGDSIAAMTEQKDALAAEIATLKTELAAKKAELAEVIAKQEIGDIYVPDINIDAPLGDNEQTEVPDRECVVEGETIEAELNAAIADLEHAIAVIEALIMDIEADIADMIALAEQIAAAVVELEKTMTDVAAAIEDLSVAFENVVAVLKDNQGVVDAVISSYEAARATALAAVQVLELTMGTANEMMGDIDAMITIIAEDAEALYNKFISDLPGCIEQIPEEVAYLAAPIMLIKQYVEENQEEINAKLQAEILKLAEQYDIDVAAVQAQVDELTALFNADEAELTAKLQELAAQYGIDEAAIKAELDAIEAKIKDEVNAIYAEKSVEFQTQIEALKEEAAVKLEELNAELAQYEAELAAAADDVKAGIREQIDRVLGDIDTVNADLACAIGHVENAAQIAYDEIVAEVTAVYEEAVAELQKALDELKAAYDAAAADVQKALDELKAAYDKAVADLQEKLAELKAAYDKAVDELTAAADKAISDLIAEAEKQIAELGKLGDALNDALDDVYAEIREELNAAQTAIEEMLKGQLESVKDLVKAIADLGMDGLTEIVNELVEQINALIAEATTADLIIDDEFKYVAIGDSSAAADSYVEMLAAALNAEALENGVDAIEVVNYAKAGNTVADERANLSDVSDADLITIGFSNVEFLSEAVDAAMSEDAVELDWAAVVGAGNVQYVELLLADVAEMIAENGIEGETAVVVNTAIEAYAYAAVQYAIELPELVNDINVVNPDAVVIVVGMYNPMDGVVITLDENVTLDISEYLDYLVDGVAVHGVAYSIISGNSIYVDASKVSTENTDSDLSILDLARMAYNGFNTLYPSVAGDDYIAAEIADALNITYVKSEPIILLGDADGNGYVNSKDAMLVAQYFADPTAVTIDLSAADVDGNGYVNSKDAMLIAQHFAGIETGYPIGAIN